jgi:putative membrane protein
MRTSLLLLGSSVILLAACSPKSDRASDQAAAGDTATTPAVAAAASPTPASPSGPTVSDAQIAAIVVAANQVDIDAGKLAESKAANAKVKTFARQMVTDHSGVNKAATALVTKLGVTPEANETSRSLTASGEQNRSALQGKSGADFDKAYIDNEVAYHQAVLDALDKTLIPNAQNAELKNMLVTTRPAFEAHLKMAKEVQGSLGR